MPCLLLPPRVVGLCSCLLRAYKWQPNVVTMLSNLHRLPFTDGISLRLITRTPDLTNIDLLLVLMTDTKIPRGPSQVLPPVETVVALRAQIRELWPLALGHWNAAVPRCQTLFSWVHLGYAATWNALENHTDLKTPVRLMGLPQWPRNDIHSIHLLISGVPGSTYAVSPFLPSPLSFRLSGS